jgi:hypothetical protein
MALVPNPAYKRESKEIAKVIQVYKELIPVVEEKYAIFLQLEITRLTKKTKCMF